MTGKPGEFILASERMVRGMMRYHISLEQRVMQRGPVVCVTSVHASELEMTGMTVIVVRLAIYPTAVWKDMSECTFDSKLAVALSKAISYPSRSGKKNPLKYL